MKRPYGMLRPMDRLGWESITIEVPNLMAEEIRDFSLSNHITTETGIRHLLTSGIQRRGEHTTYEYDKNDMSKRTPVIHKFK